MGAHVDGHPTTRRRLFSLEARLAIVTSVVLVVVSTTLFLELVARERAKLIAAKASAASMVIELLSTELTAAIDLGDAEDVATHLNDLHGNPDIVGASVWTDPAKPATAGWTKDGSPPLLAPGPGDGDGAATSADWLVATRTIAGQGGVTLGRARIVFTLAPENEAFRKNRLQLFWTTAAITIATALLLGLLARRYVVGPLSRLAHAASALADGDLSARVDVRSDDEIGDLARAFNVMGRAVAFREERLRKEIDLAQHIQSSILPRTLEVSGLGIAARMIPTSQVGGDYYDLLPSADGCWIGIGDVAGHGLDAGLIMLMLQASVAALVARDPSASPRDVLCTLNEVLFDNIHNRLVRDDHATLTLLRYHRDGSIVFSGAHEEIVVFRASEGRCEVVRTPGTWVGGRRDIRRGTVESSLRLSRGDVMLLHTDGVTEIRDAGGEPFGLERLCAELERVHAEPPQGIVDHLVQAVGAWGNADDDVSLMVFRYEG
jgi:serine phosphatase RsbU (regulator of sigma subunit)